MATQKIVKIRIDKGYLFVDLSSVGPDDVFDLDHALAPAVFAKFCKLAGFAKVRGGGWRKTRGYSTFSAPFSVVGYKQ